MVKKLQRQLVVVLSDDVFVAVLMSPDIAFITGYSVIKCVSRSNSNSHRSWIAGFLMGGNLRMLGAALATCAAVWVWTLANIVPLFLLLKKFGLLRSREEQEEAGLDVALHGGFA
jgi:ammonia channel protein AmtB